MQMFKEIVEGKVYRLEMPSKALGSPITLITSGKRNFLIDCGSCDSAVVNYLVPALKKKKIPLSKINFLMFTHCHPKNMGGAYKLKQLAPNIRVMATTSQADRMKNPMFYMLQRWSGLEDFTPPFREVRGVIAENTRFEEAPEFDEIAPILTPGHDDGSVCWWILDGDIVVCGDALQGKGADEAGMACYNDLDAYKNSLERVMNYNTSKEGDRPSYRHPKILLCNSDINGMENTAPEDDDGQKQALMPKGVIVGEEACARAIKLCKEVTKGYENFLKEYMRAHGVNKEMIDFGELLSEFFANEKKPSCLGYAMMTFKAHGVSDIGVS